jgi:hypothetical protein
MASTEARVGIRDDYLMYKFITYCNLKYVDCGLMMQVVTSVSEELIASALTAVETSNLK